MIPTHVVSRDFTVTESMQAAIDKHVAHLETFFDRATECDVVISSPHRHQHKGRIFHINVKLHVPGADIIVNRETEQNSAHEDFYLALRDAFRSVDRKLQEHVQKIRGFQKHHESRAVKNKQVDPNY